jgi:hypothetical protein
MKEFKKAMYLVEEEFVLVGDVEPFGIMFACVFEDGTVIDYGGSPIDWVKVDWDKTNELWESKGLNRLENCDFESEVCVDWNGSNWVLIDRIDYFGEDDDEDNGDEMTGGGVC